MATTTFEPALAIAPAEVGGASRREVETDWVALVERATRGDRSARDALYRRFAPMVHGQLLAKLPPACADDLVQEVFLKAFQRLDQLHEPSAFPGWLRTIARRLAADRYRRAPHVPLAEHHALTPAIESALDAQAALELIRQLPETYRAVLLMRLAEGLTGPEIAARTGMTPGIGAGPPSPRDEAVAGRTARRREPCVTTTCGIAADQPTLTYSCSSALSGRCVTRLTSR